MNKNVVRGNEMNCTEMKIVGLLFGKTKQTPELAKPWSRLIAILFFGVIFAGLSQQSYGGPFDFSRPTREEIEACQSEVKDYHAVSYPGSRLRSDELWARYAADPRLEYKLRLHKPERDAMLAAEHDLYEFCGSSVAVMQISFLRADLKKVIVYRKRELADAIKNNEDKRFIARLKVEACLMQDRLSKLDGKSLVRSTPSSSSENSAVTPVADMVRLSQKQIASCSEDIRRTQLESQSWPGDANAVAVRLGKYQKELFEGRCAGHPEAQAYLAGANKMLGYGGNSAGSGSGSLPPLASSDGTTGSGSPDPSRTRKVHNPAADAKGCTQMIQGKERGVLSPIGGNKTFVNNCPTAVEFFWCSDAECDRDSGNTWTIHVGKSWPVSGTNVRWGACRGANSGGFDKGSHGTRYTCPNLTW